MSQISGNCTSRKDPHTDRNSLRFSDFTIFNHDIAARFSLNFLLTKVNLTVLEIFPNSSKCTRISNNLKFVFAYPVLVLNIDKYKKIPRISYILKTWTAFLYFLGVPLKKLGIFWAEGGGSFTNEMFRPGTEEGKATEGSWTGQTPAFCSLLERLGPGGTCN